MDSTTTQIEALLQQIKVIQRNSVQVTQRFKAHSTQMTMRAVRIRRDVKDWEAAIANIQATQEAVEITREMYHFPPCVDDVLMRGKRNPKLVCASIAHLAQAAVFLDSHPSTDAGEKLAVELKEKAASLVEIADKVVISTASTAMEAITGQPAGSSRRRESFSSPTTTTDLVVPLPARVLANLDSVGTITQALFKCSDRKNLGADCLKALTAVIYQNVARQIDRSYADDYTSVRAISRIYRKGSHPLLAISENARRDLAAGVTILNKLIIVPTEEDYELVDVAANLFSNVIARIVELFSEAVDTPVKELSARLQGTARRQHGRAQMDLAVVQLSSELMYTSLDFLTDLWRWRDLAALVPGDKSVSQDAANGKIETFSEVVKRFLEDFRRMKGTLEKDFLQAVECLYPKCNFSDVALDLSASLSPSWLPPSDCSTHETTSALMHVLAVVCTEYFGAAKIALAKKMHLRQLLNSSADAAVVSEAAQEVTNTVVEFVHDCLRGHAMDLSTIADVARHSQLQSGDAYKTSPVVNVPLFLLNNYHTILQAFDRESCFSSEKRKPIFRDLVEEIEGEADAAAEDFVNSWQRIFPPIEPPGAGEKWASTEIDIEVLRCVVESTDPLTKEQRLVVKCWYEEATANVIREVRNSSFHTLLKRAIRLKLLEGAAAEVQRIFGEMDKALGGRQWSRRPYRHIKPSISEIVSEINKLF